MKKTIFAVAAFIASFGALAQSAPANLPPPIAVAVGGGLKLESTFKAPGGMTGWVLSSGVGQNMVVYTPADGSVAIAGNMVDAKGANLTKEHLSEYAPKPDFDKLWSEAEKSTWVAEGAEGKAVKSTIYVFEDANCSFCHLAWKALQPYQKAGLQVRWIPVAFLSPSSFDKAAAVLGDKDPSEAFSKRHENFKAQGAVAPASPALRAKIDANNKLMQAWGFRGTPTFVYKDRNGKVLTSNGMPSMGQLAAITGLPEQKQTDPELARFK